MSPLSSERRVAALHPGGVDILRGRRSGWRRGGNGLAVEHHHLPAGPAAADAPAWRGAADCLAAIDPGRGDLEVVISNHFVRYLALPWTSLVAAGGDGAALARATFELTWGEAAAGWTVVVDPLRFGRPCLAAAVDSELVAAVRQAAADKGLRLAALRPHLTAALAAAGLAVKGGKEAPAHWFAAWEPGRLAVMGEGVAHNLKLASPDALGPALAQCVAADRLVSGAAGRIVLHAPGWQGELPAGDILRAEAPGGEVDWGQAMAWCGW